jgi:carboxypeptidase Taq
MQDVHWYAETIGGTFQGYTLGNILSGQFLGAAMTALPDIPERTERGEFGGLRRWLAKNIHRHGRKYTAEELVTRVTGKSFDIEPYFNYLEIKFGELYRL